MDLTNLCFIPADKAKLTIESRRVANSTAICPKTRQEISTPPAHILDMKVEVTVEGMDYKTEVKNVLYKDANNTLDLLIRASFIHAEELRRKEVKDV